MQHLSAELIRTMTGRELVAAYNTLNPEKPIKRFQDRSVGITRVLAALESARPEEPVEPVEKPAQDRTAAGEARRVFRPEGELKPPRPASKRGKLLDRLLQPEGMLREEIEDAFGWSPRDAMDALRLLAKFNGYIMFEDAEGRWRGAMPDAD